MSAHARFLRALVPGVLLAALAAAPRARADEDTAPQPPAPPAAAGGAEAPAQPAPLAFGGDLDAAREAARRDGKALLLVVVPDWFESPAWKRVESQVLPDAKASAPLADFVRVLVRETRDREVHVRHRLAFAGYPLAVVLDSEGRYLGHVSGVPAEGEGVAWPERLAAIPPRAARIAELRTRLAAAPEDAQLLFDLGVALSDAGEDDRADALFERMEAADPLAPAERLGEARYRRLRHAVDALLLERRFGDVEARCLRWRRRFESHARLPDVLELQANALFLAGSRDEARALWQRLVDEHADTPWAARSKERLEKL